MHQCLHCDQPCNTSTMSCNHCGEILDTRPLQQEYQTDADIADLATTPVKTVSLHSEGISTNSDGAMFPLSSSALVSVDAPLTSGPSEVGNYPDVIEQTLRMLNEAALRIAAFEHSTKRHLRPSRLSRYLDISSEIQRQNTPLPPINKTTDDLSKQLVAIWPWLEDEDEPEHAKWHHHTDPLALRRWPALLSGLPVGQEHSTHITDPITFSPGRRFSFARVAMFSLILLTVFGLVVDGVLVAMTLSHHPSTTIAIPAATGSPTLVLSENKASFGQIVHIHILHFSAASSVLLTHDIGMSIKTNVGNGFIRLGQAGSKDVTFSIDSTWLPGLHTLEAEDMSNHYTAFATLQVVSGSIFSTPLGISSTSLNFGADMQGTNILQVLMLYNNGSGPISWSAYSDQPWLRIAPARGTYSASQSVIVGVQRSNLQPRNYSATITISTSTGDLQQVQVTMAVQPLHSSRGAVLSVTPVVMALTTHAGAIDPDTQYLAVSNPGSQDLYWSLVNNLPIAIANPGPIPAANWLSLDQAFGVVAPGMTSLIGVHTYSSRLLPGTYMNDLLFAVSSGHTMQDTPQHVAVALTVQP
jgi:Viral BACON domain